MLEGSRGQYEKQFWHLQVTAERSISNISHWCANCCRCTHDSEGGANRQAVGALSAQGVEADIYQSFFG